MLIATLPSKKMNVQEAFMFESTYNFTITMATVFFLIGFITLGISIFILTKQAMGKNLQTIAEQTTKLAGKGITENISGLVGNASSLINALDDLARSNTGIGIFLVFLSLVLIGAAYFLVQQINFPLP